MTSRQLELIPDVRNGVALRQFGGKWRLAPWIVGELNKLHPRHQIYTEVYGGFYSVGLHKLSAPVEVYNDLDLRPVSLFRCLKDPAKLREFEQRLSGLARDAAEYEQASALVYGDDLSGVPEMDLAIAHYLNQKLSVAGAGGRWSSGTSEARLALASVQNDNNLPAIHQRLQGVAILNQDALAVLEEFDGPEALHYIDWPYPWDSPNRKSRDSRCKSLGAPRRQYRFEMKPRDHEAALKFITQGLRGAVVISGYSGSPVCDRYLESWPKVFRETRTTDRSAGTEFLWLKPAKGKL